jgi:hypothetical protein
MGIQTPRSTIDMVSRRSWETSIASDLSLNLSNINKQVVIEYSQLGVTYCTMQRWLRSTASD